jgi:hypothetical protein
MGTWVFLFVFVEGYFLFTFAVTPAVGFLVSTVDGALWVIGMLRLGLRTWFGWR